MSEDTTVEDKAGGELSPREFIDANYAAISEGRQLEGPDGLTVNGNDPRLEMHYENDLDPMRVLPPTGYPYLDHVQRMSAEVQRAAVEGREPDLENPGPMASTPLKSVAQLTNPMNGNVAAQLPFAKPAEVLDEAILDEGDGDDVDAAGNDESGSTTSSDSGSSDSGSSSGAKKAVAKKAASSSSKSSNG